MKSSITLYGPDGRKLPQRRNYDAAKATRYTADWMVSDGPADKYLRADLKTLRDRARDAERNDSYAEALLAEVESNIIGEKGIQLKPLACKADARNKNGVASKPDVSACEKIAHWWDDYSRLGKFEVTRRFSRPMFERMAVRSMARDGGFLVRLLDGSDRNEYGFSVQGIEVDALNRHTNDAARRIYMGTEFDEFDAPVAYHLSKIDLKNWGFVPGETYRVEAKDLIHLYVAKRASQSQGVSWLAPVLLILRQLSKFEEAEVIAARENSEKMGFFIREGDQRYTGEEDEDGNIVAPSSPGQWEELPHGLTPHALDPKHPNSNYPDFRKAMLRKVCAAFPSSYNTIARDLEGVSYSSIRQGVLSERDAWRMLQHHFVSTFEAPVYERALRMALLSGQLEGLSILDYERLKHAEFSGRTWAWVDPLKDIDAAREEIALGINSRQNICREKGRDFAAMLDQNEEDRAKMEAAGLPVDSEKPAATVVEDGE